MGSHLPAWSFDGLWIKTEKETGGKESDTTYYLIRKKWDRLKNNWQQKSTCVEEFLFPKRVLDPLFWPSCSSWTAENDWLYVVTLSGLTSIFLRRIFTEQCFRKTLVQFWLKKTRTQNWNGKEETISDIAAVFCFLWNRRADLSHDMKKIWLIKWHIALTVY